MAQQLSIPKGTRDFLPFEMVRRNFIFDTIRKVFITFGYLPIETPAMENLSTLLGKYGEEGDKLLFRILNSGNFLGEINNADLQQTDYQQLASIFCEKGLRYDLTVPFARFVVMHRNELTFPLKRYQIQPVWRADRPQKGRYREFYQCDVDVIGSDSLLNEVELLQIIDAVFGKLNIRSVIKINNRKILSAIAELIGESDKMTDIMVAVDKIEKVGMDKIIEELLAKGISSAAIDKLKPLLGITGTTLEKLEILKKVFSNSNDGKTGIEELEYIFNTLDQVSLQSEVVVDLTLARGLNYYTGAIIEVKAKDVEIGSICGGGRYDNLTGIFGLPGISGTGISFGADRIFDVMNQLNLFPDDSTYSDGALFLNFGENEARYCLPVIDRLRKAGISAELYPDTDRIKKQMTYADSRKIKYVILAGADEVKDKMLTLKNMQSGDQSRMNPDELIARLHDENNY
ncbi:MAG: histidine--tRNA ligase [Bacteroidia bacterium]|nr:histidine--tRNA ligase [Bacteroidia bacterium]